MNVKALTLTLACALAPIAVMADGPNASPAPGPQLTQSQRDAMKAYEDKSMALHQQARTQILGALTPANKSLLASVVSQLALAAQPDPRAAAQQLDAALSPTERQAILAAAASLHDQEKALRALMASAMPPRPDGENGHGSWHAGGAMHAPDAGAILLMTAMGSAAGPHMGMMGSGDPPMGNTPPRS